MRTKKRKFAAGATLIELTIAMAMSTIVVFAIGALLLGAQRAWQKTYNSTNKQIRQDAQAVISVFGRVGRKANRLGYTIYNTNGSVFSPVAADTAEEVVSGDAVEFRYWDSELETTGKKKKLLDITKLAEVYALFYIDGGALKVDYGQYPPGAVPAGGGDRNTANITTEVLAENVSTVPGIGAFSHRVLNGTGDGCVKLNLTITDPVDSDTVRVMAAAMMRNNWPR